MHEYDTVLKSLLTDSSNSLFHLITGVKRGRWLNVELPKVVQSRVDLLFELASTRELILLELQSNHPADAVLSILGLYADRLETVRRILQRIAKMKGSARKIAFSRLLILAGVRQLAGVVEEEAKHMPILNDIMDHEVIGPAIRKGRKEGKAEGKAEGKLEGRIEGASALAQRMLTARFGPLSATTKKRIAKLTLPELEDLAIRLLTAKSIAELFPR